MRAVYTTVLSFYFHQKSKGILHLLFECKNIRIWGNYLLQVLPAKSEGILPLDGNVLEIALQLYSALRFERLKIIYLFKNKSGFLGRSFFPFNALGMPLFNNSVDSGINVGPIYVNFSIFAKFSMPHGYSTRILIFDSYDLGPVCLLVLFFLFQNFLTSLSDFWIILFLSLTFPISLSDFTIELLSKNLITK